jgi:uncharacterized protein
VLAWGLGLWLGIDPGERFYLSGTAVVAGVLASVPLLLGLRWTLSTSFPPVRRLVEVVQDQLGPLIARRSSLELAALATLAGLAEEILFRGVVQVAIARVVPEVAALVLASIAFGLAHFITRAYALLAGIAGLYLGTLFLAQGNLLVPVVAHALYDFIALMCLVRRYRARREAAG